MTMMRPQAGTQTANRSETLGLRFAEIRRNLGLSLREVSLRCGIPVSTLSKVQNHQTTLNYEGLVRLSVGLGVDIGEFFRRDSASLLDDGMVTMTVVPRPSRPGDSVSDAASP